MVLPSSLPPGCTPWDSSLPMLLYDYDPSLAAGYAFSIIFGLSMIAHAVQGVWKHGWIGTKANAGWASKVGGFVGDMLFAIAALSETLGWSGRTYSSHCPYEPTAYTIQIVTLIIAPVFLTAAIYVILGRLITIFGPQTSPLSAKAYLWVFCTCDVVSLVVQALGGAVASRAVTRTPPKNPKKGRNIMLVGVVFQLVSLAVFGILFAVFLVRTRRSLGAGNSEQNSTTRKWTRGIKRLIVASIFSTLMVFARSVYRAFELGQGRGGYLNSREGYFIGLDATLMVLAIVVYNFVHPGWCFQGVA